MKRSPATSVIGVKPPREPWLCSIFQPPTFTFQLRVNLLVTGGCGFIGSNFIRQRLLEKNSPLGKLVNLDALTYAGNPANLADLAGDSRYVFAHGDIGDTALVPRLLTD